MENDIQTLALLVSISYLPEFRSNIDKSAEPDNIKEILEARYKELQTMCNKYLQE